MTDRSMVGIVGAVVTSILIMLGIAVYRYEDEQQHCIQWVPYDHEENECTWTMPDSQICVQWEKKMVHSTRCARRDDQ